MATEPGTERRVIKKHAPEQVGNKLSIDEVCYTIARLLEWQGVLSQGS